MSIKNVIDNGYCIGCGACNFIENDNIKISMMSSGFYQATIKNINTEQIDKVCPFSDFSKNEDDLGQTLYSKNNLNFDDKVGYYNKIFAGHVKDTKSRILSSSGGLTSWLTEKLFIEDEIDAVIHVGLGIDKNIFEYKISRSIDDVRCKSNKKSRYYPVTYKDIIKTIKNSDDRFLFIGIPCFVKSIRLLQSEGYLNNIKYVASLLCGHMKSKGFSESLAWQVGIQPKNIKAVDFRVKKEGYKASEYFFEAEDKKNNKKVIKNNLLSGTNWGEGFFRHKSCDYCDDIAGELADISLGDAWLSKYTDDYLGTNICVVRNKKIEGILEKYSSELYIDNADVNTFFDTQSGNYRNRRGSIIAHQKTSKEWMPIKRNSICEDYGLDDIKNNIYLYRSLLSRKSIENFNIAKKINSRYVFSFLMAPYLFRYHYMLYGFKYAVLSLVPYKVKNIIKRLK